jgi:hypothetical protein
MCPSSGGTTLFMQHLVLAILVVADMVYRKRFRHNLECSSHGGGDYVIFFKGFGRILLSRDNVAKTWPSNGVAGHSLCLLLPSEVVCYRGAKGAYYTELADVKLTNFMLKFFNHTSASWV